MLIKSIYNTFADFVQKLASSIKKNDVLIDIDYSDSELKTVVLPTLMSVKRFAFSGTLLTEIEMLFKRNVKLFRKGEHPIEFIHTVAQSLAPKIEDLEKEVKSVLHDENQKSTLDYYKLNLIKYADAIHFFNEYTRRLINAFLFQTENSPEDQSMMKQDLEWVSNPDNQLAYTTALNMLALSFKDFLESIKPLKHHVFNESDWEGGANVTNTRLDPFKTNFVNVNWNLWYLMASKVNQWQVLRHQRNKEELERTKQIVLKYELLKQDTKDPDTLDQLNRKIAYYDNLAHKAQIKIERFEEE